MSVHVYISPKNLQMQMPRYFNLGLAFNMFSSFSIARFAKSWSILFYLHLLTYYRWISKRKKLYVSAKLKKKGREGGSFYLQSVIGEVFMCIHIMDKNSRLTIWCKEMFKNKCLFHIWFTHKTVSNTSLRIWVSGDILL